jgi:hypothetical protein
MSPRFRPPGKTFKERWPQDAEETRYLAASATAPVVGGILGLFGVPLGIWDQVSSFPMALVILLGIAALITLAIPRAPAATRRWVTLAWKITAWVLAAAVVGLVVESIARAMCDDSCRVALRPGKGSFGMMFTYILLVAGSIGSAVLVDRYGNALRRRALGPAAP